MSNGGLGGRGNTMREFMEDEKGDIKFKIALEQYLEQSGLPENEQQKIREMNKTTLQRVIAEWKDGLNVVCNCYIYI